MDTEHYTFLKLEGWPFWARVKMGLALLLTPFTLPILGRLITVSVEKPGSAARVCPEDEEQDEVPAD